MPSPMTYMPHDRELEASLLLMWLGCLGLVYFLMIVAYAVVARVI